MLSSTRWERITEWWQPKAGAILSLLLFYFAVWDVPFETAWRLLFFSTLTLAGFGLTGYFLNDLADLPFDKKVGKSNMLEGVSKPTRIAILVSLITLTAFPWFFYLRADAFSFALIGLQLFLMFAYPIPPLRFKDKPRLGMVSDALYAFGIPSVLAWHTMDLTAGLNENQEQLMHLVALFGWMLVMGLRHIVNHHVYDQHNDLKTNTPNLALEVTASRLRKRLQTFVFPAELIFALSFFVFVGRSSGFLPIFFATIIVFVGASMIGDNKFWFKVSFSKTILDHFVSFYFGLISVFFLTLDDSRYVIIALIFVTLLTSWYSHPVVRVIVTRSLNHFRTTVTFPYRIASLSFNWSLYYFRKWILKWDEPRNWGEHYEKRLSDLEKEAVKKEGVVAVFNQNWNKYTETFVNGHLNRLPMHVVPFYGWPDPIHSIGMQNLLSDSEYVQASKKSLWQLSNVDNQHKVDMLVSQELICDNASLILAEFGPMGARVVPIAQMCGIPLIVIFYGYDAWHKRTLEENKAVYKELFKYASAVLGVSRDICSQLEIIGCPSDKIEYLPCYVNLDRFAYLNRDFETKTILAVGRFCVTKAPHLTILAFNEVLKKHPEAKLRMIGADEGNEILETCKSLVRSLQITEKVSFLGSLSSDEVKDEMHLASIFTQHSVTAPETGDKEGTPVAVMEAMATGLPVVATNHAGISEMIETGKTGILIQEFDYIGAALEISNLLDNPARMKEMGMQAADSIRANDLVVNHIDLLTEIIKKHQVIV